MVVQTRNIISESEKNRIRSLYGLKTEKEYVFDFVLTENNKYVILMDQVFVEGGGGKSIGSIWDNTHIFNELIRESFSKLETINESVKENINSLLETIIWKKDDIRKWLSEGSVVTEEEEKGFFGKLWDKTKEIGSSALSFVFKQGIIPALRWIRRNAQTNIGIVLDVVIAILSFKSSAAIWALICLLDIYEISTGDYDPKDPERQQMPFFYLVTDLLACFLTVGSAVLFRNSAMPVIKSGGKMVMKNSKVIGFIKTLLSKIPGAKNFLKSILNALSKSFPKASSIISTISRGIDTILVKVEQFLAKLFPAAVAGVATLGVVKGMEYGIGKSGAQDKIGSVVQNVDRKIKGLAQTVTGKENIGQLNVDKESQSLILQRLQARNNQQ